MQDQFSRTKCNLCLKDLNGITVLVYIFVWKVQKETYCEFLVIQIGIPVGEMVVVFNAQPLMDNKKSLKDYGVKDGELIMVIRTSTLLRRAAEHRLQQQRRQQRNFPSGMRHYKVFM